MAYYTNQYPDRYVSNFESSLQFYDTLLERLGCIRFQTEEINNVKIARYGADKSIDLTIYKDPNYQKTNPLQPIKDFFFVESQNIVDTFHITAMEAGASTVWMPESERDTSYSTCVQDPDGYTIAVKYNPSYKMLFVARNNINIFDAIERLKHQVHSVQMQAVVISLNKITQENKDEKALIEEKQLACFIYHLPSKWVIKFADTPDRMTYWMHLRGFYRAVSICWQAKLIGDKNDLLLQLLDERLIDNLHYESARLRADTFQALWYLIQAGEEFIREATLKLGCEYPFVSAQELFCYIIRTHIDNGFNVCRRSYYTVSMKDISDATKIRLELVEIINTILESKNIIKNPKIHLKRIKGLASRFPKNSWLEFSVGVCTLKAENNGFLRDKLAACITSVKRDDENATIALSRKRSSKTFEKLHSFTWQNGKMISASKHGGVYRS